MGVTSYQHDNKTTQYVPDELNRIAQVVNAQGTTQYDYFRDSQLKTVTYPNNIRSRYTYDTAGRVDTIINTQNSAVVSSYDYDYDRNGNRTEQIEINGGAAETTTYDFDDLDRLTGVTYPDQTVTYTYDLAYNRKSEIARSSDNTVTKHWQYQYNDRHQLTDILDQLDNANSITYSYDDNGNQTAKTKASEITAFVFDARDDMRKVQVGGSTVGQFLYDAAGLRIEKAGDRGIERYTYDDLSVLRQFDENNQTLAKFDYGPNRLLSLRHSTEGTQFYLMDALNSVVNLANASGAVQARYQYDAWGNQRNVAGDSWNRFGFTGHEHDTESGLIYAKARFYDPETGRFLGQDAWEGDTELPPSLHKYLYAYGNPTVYVDPTGNYNEAGHYYTTMIVALEAGYSVERARTLAFYSQVPDEIGQFDAKKLGIGLLKNSISFGLLGGSASMEETSRFGEGTHVLTGANAESQKNAAANIISANTSDEDVGWAIHAYGDSSAHLTQGHGDENTYGKIIGHTVPSILGMDPDQIHRRRDVYRKHVRGLYGLLSENAGNKFSEESLNNLLGELDEAIDSSMVVRNRKEMINGKISNRSTPFIDHNQTDKNTIRGVRDIALKKIEESLMREGFRADVAREMAVKMMDVPERNEPGSASNDIDSGNDQLEAFKQTRPEYSSTEKINPVTFEDVRSTGERVTDKMRYQVNLDQDAEIVKENESGI